MTRLPCHSTEVLGETDDIDWQTGYVEANGIRLHYTRTVAKCHRSCWRTGLPTPVPAGRRSRRYWPPIRRDHGRRAWAWALGCPGGGYGPAEHAEDLAGVIVGSRTRRPAYSVTRWARPRHWSSPVPTPNCRRDPSKIRRRGGPSGSPHRSTERRARMRERAHRAEAENRAELIAGQQTEHPGWSDAELEPWADAKLRFSPNVLSVYRPGQRVNVDWPAVLGRITCPALLIISDPERGGDRHGGECDRAAVAGSPTEIAHIPEPVTTSAATVRSLHGRCPRLPLRSPRHSSGPGGLTEFQDRTGTNFVAGERRRTASPI